ncbi:MAG: 4-(cytidine 5'-diphospho)-2-C-methyl-D-erythritol kinase [Dehalococcoidia bacterium]
MTRGLRLLAPAKINWTLEVLRIRADGYHELRSVLQTVSLCDVVNLREAAAIELVMTGDAGPLADEPPERNLAHRAAAVLREHAGARRGVRIELEKHVPVAAGLGGGSSDVAAVLRGLNVLWGLGLDDHALMRVAAVVGSDPPFFIASGTAAVSGRGQHVELLVDAIAAELLLAMPREHRRGEKTAAMFSALTPSDFSEGYATIGVRDAVEAGRAVVDAELCNVFERVTARMQPETELAMDALRAQGLTPHLAGAGPSFFLLLDAQVDGGAASKRVRELGFEPRVVRTLGREDALRIEEL